MSDLKNTISELCQKAKEASHALSLATSETKTLFLGKIAEGLETSKSEIFSANRRDLENGRSQGLSQAMLDRLEINETRMAKMIQGVRDVADLPDPVGQSLKDWDLYNGIHMQKIRVPIGVIGIIYESRPNVTVDAGVLCLKTGNVPVLRGGKEAFQSNQALIAVMQDAAEQVGLPRAVVSFIPTTDREAIPIFCSMDQAIDLMIPRGGYGLIETVVEHARMPVIKHFHGVCHVYVHEHADLAMAESIVLNAKCQRPGVCNALETLLVDSRIAKAFVPQIVKALKEKGVEVLGDSRTSEALEETLNEPESWYMEYLDRILAIRQVDDIKEAVQHINHYGSRHTDTIVTEDESVAEQFFSAVDSASVFWNVSTRFSDGAQFGFGAEIGISTDKIHARGPMGLEELTSYKYVGR
ncbi:MAG: glutamate-5-semialdehyde dehydrogenase, partial [Verrucomicrobiota bacterium]